MLWLRMHIDMLTHIYETAERTVNKPIEDKLASEQRYVDRLKERIDRIPVPDIQEDLTVAVNTCQNRHIDRKVSLILFAFIMLVAFSAFYFA